MVGEDVYAHVWEGNTKNEEAMGKHGNGRRNSGPKTVVDFTMRWEQVASSIMFVKGSIQRTVCNS